MKKSYSMIVGIDVSKLKLDVWLMRNPQDLAQEHFIISNNEKGIKELIKHLKKLKITTSETLFCFEDTGVYGMPLCYCLSKQEADYSVVNALEIKRSKGLTRGKNDKNDAKDIAVYACIHQHKMSLSELPELDISELKLLIAERDKLIKTIGIMNRTRESEGFMPKEVMKQLSRVNKQTVKFLRQQLKALEKLMQEVINRSEKIKSQITLIRSVPGIGPQTALYLVVTTKCFESFDNWRQLSCYAGIAPFEYSSGSSIRGRTKVSHLADKKMKSLLQMGVLTALKYDSEIKAYYEKKKAEGKPPMLVMNNVRNKMVARVFAVINRGTPFINTRKFAA